MMVDTVNEGDVVLDGQGNRFRIDSGGNPVPEAQYKEPTATNNTSISQDVKSGAVPWLARGVEDLAGTPAALTDLAARGAHAASNYVPSALGGDYLASGSEKLANSGFVKNWGPEGWAKTGDPLVQSAGFDPNYQPQTKTGGFVRTGLEFAPSVAASMLAGPETMYASLARGAGAAAASEGLGQAVESYTGPDSKAGAIARMAGALAGGHLAPKAVTPFPAANQARVAAADQLAQDIKPYGGRIDAAQRTGSPTLRNLTGDAPNNDAAVTQMLLTKGNIPTGQPLPAAAAAATKQAGQDLSTARSNAWMVRDTPFWNKLQSIEADAKTTYPKGSKQLQEVEDALKQARTPSQGTGNQRRIGQLSGKDYLRMKNDMLSSKNPHVNELGLALEEAGQRTPGAPWQSIDQRYADAMRAGSAAKAGGPFSNTLSPNAVLNATDAKGRAIRTATPMSEAAQRAADVLAPVPGKPSSAGKFLIPAVGAAAGFMAPGTEHMTGAILGAMLGSDAHPALTSMRQALLQRKLPQQYLGNQRLLPGRDYRSVGDAKMQRALIGGPIDQPFLNYDKNSGQ